MSSKDLPDGMPMDALLGGEDVEMDAFWEWCWQRFGRRFSWAAFLGQCANTVPIFLAAAWVVVTIEGSDRYGPALLVAAVSSLVLGIATIRPGSRAAWGHVERWASHRSGPDREALESTYRYGRSIVRRGALVWTIGGAASGAVISAMTGASAERVAQYLVVGANLGSAMVLVAVHGWTETMLRPVRRAIAGDSDVGDDLPRARPSLGTWSNIVVLACIWVFGTAGALVGAAVGALDPTLTSTEMPIVGVMLGTGMALFFGVPLTLATSFGPSLQPLYELAEGTRRVAAGDLSQRVPVLQDDDLGRLAASFNRMQAGLLEREQLQAAFGSYVDPALAARLLAQGSDVFSGERVEVTVMFVDIRDFTPFAEANTAEVAVAHLNDLFEIVVATAGAHRGHVNKFLGDGALVVFGAPELVEHHADLAVAAAVDIQRAVRDRFEGTTRVGIGVNTGTVIAGTIGGGGKLEFTLIGDAVNVAARVEQLTKTTSDSILITDATARCLTNRRPAMHHRGSHPLKGRSEPVVVHAIDPLDTVPA